MAGPHKFYKLIKGMVIRFFVICSANKLQYNTELLWQETFIALWQIVILS